MKSINFIMITGKRYFRSTTINVKSLKTLISLKTNKHLLDHCSKQNSLIMKHDQGKIEA